MLIAKASEVQSGEWQIRNAMPDAEQIAKPCLELPHVLAVIRKPAPVENVVSSLEETLFTAYVWTSDVKLF